MLGIALGEHKVRPYKNRSSIIQFFPGVNPDIRKKTFQNYTFFRLNSIPSFP